MGLVLRVILVCLIFVGGLVIAMLGMNLGFALLAPDMYYEDGLWYIYGAGLVGGALAGFLGWKAVFKAR